MQRRHWVHHGVTGACLAPSVEAGAQELPRLEPGVPIRLLVRTVAGSRAFVGGLVGLSYDSVTIVRRLRPETVALRSVERFEISRGRPRAVMIGAPILGAAMGTLFGATAIGPPAGCDVLPDDERCSWETPPVIVGMAGGAVLFALVTHILVPQVWQAIPLEVLIGRQTALGAPASRLGLHLRF